MHAIRTLLEAVLDYAGLFPPAKLEMGPTVRNYARYRSAPDAWMLGRLVVPVARFGEFEREAAALLPVVGRPLGAPDDDDAWAVTALTAAAGDAAFAADLDAIRRFNDRHAEAGAGSVLVDCIEAKASTPEELDRALDLVPEEIVPYFEIPAAGDPRGLIATLAGLDAAAKIRTGGVTADAHPSPADVARFIISCARAEVPFKATAGLHHPLRHHAADVGCRQHGFLNVFVGAALAWHEKLDEAELAALLEVEASDAFRFTDEGVSWGDRRLSNGELRTSREAFAHAFGSCSFEEPLADLRAARLLRAETATR